ncbi:MAG TPA: DNA-primase RepB domain-containing protein [Candidatus Acidoferrales bacterium]|nr:DNA-primase RepB domain-containing protein [Candidatus Acidoferrales bacterium]
MNSNLESKLDSLSAPDYILQNFEASDRIAVLVRSRKAGETIQRITTATNAASQDFQAWLRHKNVSSDVYIGMNTLRHDAQSRTKEDIEAIRHLYLDIDRNGPSALEAVETSGLVPRPNYVLETSPEKYQVVWKVEGIAQDQAETLQRAMVREFGGDPAATDSTRVLRLPEFVNRKYATEHVVRAQPGATQTYHLEDFRLRTDLHETPAQYRSHDAPSPPAGEITQSERDWAFAKRALARGDDPEEIIRRIADYRGEEKHPGYARHTVEKAQAHFQSARPTHQVAGNAAVHSNEPSREQ